MDRREKRGIQTCKILVGREVLMHLNKMLTDGGINRNLLPESLQLLIGHHFDIHYSTIIHIYIHTFSLVMILLMLLLFLILPFHYHAFNFHSYHTNSVLISLYQSSLVWKKGKSVLTYRQSKRIEKKK